MSWDSYIQTMLASNNLADAAICDPNGAIWAKSAGFAVSKSKYLIFAIFFMMTRALSIFVNLNESLN